MIGRSSSPFVHSSAAAPESWSDRAASATGARDADDAFACGTPLRGCIATPIAREKGGR